MRRVTQRVVTATLLGWLASGCGAPSTGAPPETTGPTAAAPGRSTASSAPAPDRPVPPRIVQPPPPIPTQVALEVTDLQRGAVLLAQRGDVLDRPVHPGSVAKVFTLRAALDRGEVDANSRIECRGREAIGGRLLVCGHPRFAGPLSPSEALAHSCNSFFIALARRVPWPAVADALRSSGLPATPAPREAVLGAIGLEGPRPTARALLSALARLVGEARRRDRPEDRILLDGLREAARVGTASALGDQGIEALAKTGSGRILNGAAGGLVVALAPAGAPRYGVVVVGAGIAGRDAAAIAGAALLRAVPALAQAASSRHDGTVSIGLAHDDGYRVVRVDLEDYVAGVVEAEAPPNAPHALREALAVAARSFVTAEGGRHTKEGFEVCDLTHCQAYRSPGEPARAAARATRGLILTGGGAVLPAFHSASCGGALEAPSALWPDPRDVGRFMPARPDPAGADEGEPWTSEASAGDVLRALRAAGSQGRELTDLRVVARTASGVVTSGELKAKAVGGTLAGGKAWSRLSSAPRVIWM